MSGWHVETFRAMGSACRIVAPDAPLAEAGVELVFDLERRWSRFRDDSEISRLNERAGDVCVVSPATFELVRRAEAARNATAGQFHPLLLDHLVRLGYDRTWTAMPTDGPAPAPRRPPVSDEPIDCHAGVDAVRLPAGTRFDPGGLGKGLAADLVADALVERGAERAQIELGGDVRVVGDHWSGGDWCIRVDDRGTGEVTATVSLAEGAVATSSRRRRRWLRDGAEYHHLIDPRTGGSAVTDLVAVTAVGPELWWAEVLAKVALIGGADEARALFARHGIRGVIVHADDRPSSDRTWPASQHEVVGAVAA